MRYDIDPRQARRRQECRTPFSGRQIRPENPKVFWDCRFDLHPEATFLIAEFGAVAVAAENCGLECCERFPITWGESGLRAISLAHVFRSGVVRRRPCFPWWPKQMWRRILTCALATGFLFGCGKAPDQVSNSAADDFGRQQAESEPRLETLSIRSIEGEMYISTDAIVSYEWGTHIITLKLGHRTSLAKKLFGGGSWKNVPFAVFIGETELYRGNFVSGLLSSSVDTVVIRLIPTDKNLTADQIRLELGYPSPAFFKGQDPRNVEEIFKRPGKDTRVKLRLKAAQLGPMADV